MRLTDWLVAGAAVAVLAGCIDAYPTVRAPAEPVQQAKPRAPQSELDVMKAAFVRPDGIPYPESNPYSHEKRDLGHALYFDPRLSKTGTMSCATCHNPALGWEDGLAFGLGHKGNTLGRHSPTVLNLAWASNLFWDGRAESLEAQATGPMLADAEMGMTEQAVIEKVKSIRGYEPMFRAAFPERDVSLGTIAAAIATFERTVVSESAPFDRWIEGDETAIGDDAKRGFVTFNTKANCAACHSGWRLTDDGFHDIGLAGKDLGRGKLVEDVVELQHAFKTPTLRNIARRAPYMHDGSVATLEGIVRHYESGFVKRASLSEEMKAYTLTPQERADLVAFMETLTSEDKPTAIPVLPN